MDTPSPVRLKQIADLMAGTFRDEFALEKLLISRQGGIRALVNIDGISLDAVSQGYRNLWPHFSQMIDVPYADYVVNELRLLIDDGDLLKDIQTGTVGLISGTSRRHFDVEIDAARLHRWHIVFRRYGTRTFADVTFEPGPGAGAVGISDLVRLDAFGAPVSA